MENNDITNTIDSFSCPENFLFKDDAIKRAELSLNYIKKNGVKTVGFDVFENDNYYYFNLQYFKYSEDIKAFTIKEYSPSYSVDKTLDISKESNRVVKNLSNYLKVIGSFNDLYNNNFIIKFVVNVIAVYKNIYEITYDKEIFYYDRVYDEDYTKKKIEQDFIKSNISYLCSVCSDISCDVYYIKPKPLYDYYEEYSYLKYESINSYKYEKNAIEKGNIIARNTNQNIIFVYYGAFEDNYNYRFYIDFMVKNFYDKKEKKIYPYYKQMIYNGGVYDFYDEALKDMKKKSSSISKEAIVLEEFVNETSNGYTFLISYLVKSKIDYSKK